MASPSACGDLVFTSCEAMFATCLHSEMKVIKLGSVKTVRKKHEPPPPTLQKKLYPPTPLPTRTHTPPYTLAIRWSTILAMKCQRVKACCGSSVGCFARQSNGKARWWPYCGQLVDETFGLWWIFSGFIKVVQCFKWDIFSDSIMIFYVCGSIFYILPSYRTTIPVYIVINMWRFNENVVLKIFPANKKVRYLCQLHVPVCM